jgi:hypothetical protein
LYLQEPMLRNFLIFIFLVVSSLASFAQTESGQKSADEAPQSLPYTFSADQIPNLDWQTRNSSQPFIPQNWFAQFQSEQLELKKSRDGDLKSADKNQLNALVDSMAKYVPGSFAYHYASYVSSDYNPEEFEHLQAAQNIRPGDPLVSAQLMNHAQVTGNNQLLRDASFYLSKSNAYSIARMEYHYNLLQGLGHGATLLTNGNGDTHPLLVLQEIEGVRKDVKIVFVELLIQPVYQKQVESKLALESGSLSRITKSQQIKHILKHCNKVYLSLTLPEAVLRSESRDTYLTGLALMYAPGYKGNNIQDLAVNWEQKFKKDHLLEADPVNVNYILPLLQLHRYYKLTDSSKSSEVDELLRTLAERTSKPSLIYQQMDN